MEGMDLGMLVTVLLGVVLVIAVVWYLGQHKRRAEIRRHFGPEYERTVREQGSEARAVSVLEARTKRAHQYRLRHLSERERRDFATSWSTTQARFVDDPHGAVGEADLLVCRLMEARGYPMSDFDRRAEDLSVDHPTVIHNYRTAHKIAISGTGKTSTEDLRRAFVCHRVLFAELLEERSTPDQRQVLA